MQSLNLIITIHIVFIPIYFFIILYIIIKNAQKYSLLSFSISSLAQLKYPYCRIFNVFTSLYGLLSVATIIKFSLIYQQDFYFLLLCLTYSCISLGTMFVGLFPKNYNVYSHNIIAGFLFISLYIFEILFIPIYTIDFRYSFLSGLTFLLFLVTTLLLYKSRDLKNEKKYALSEWIVFTGSFIWNIVFSFNILLI